MASGSILFGGGSTRLEGGIDARRVVGGEEAVSVASAPGFANGEGREGRLSDLEPCWPQFLRSRSGHLALQCPILRQ